MKNSFDRIITSAPVNKTAAIVAHGKGENWEAKPGKYNVHSAEPIKTKPMPTHDPNFKDLTGIEIGRLKVIGYYGKGGSGKTSRARWIVRCKCGAYELRTSTAIKKYDPEKAERPAMCSACDYAQKITRPEYQKGVWA